MPEDAAGERQRAQLAAALTTACGRRRGELSRRLWALERALGLFPLHASEAGQDRFLDARVFGGAIGRVFVEVGGLDGETGSNTLFFERNRGWTGLLVEASPGLAAQARRTRRCEVACCAAGGAEGVGRFIEVLEGFRQMSGLLEGYDPELLAAVRAHPCHKERIREVPVRSLAGILDAAGIRAVDYLSIDIEGAERVALEAFPFDRIPVGAWTVENNSGDPAIPRLMARNGFELVEFIGADEVYLPAGRAA